MSHCVVFAFPGNESLAQSVSTQLGFDFGCLRLRHFPDGEWYVRVEEEVAGRDVVVVCSLDRPNDKLVALYLLARTLRELRARRVLLAAPYLCYMRQDIAFNHGEGVAARYVAQWLSEFVDGIVTVDPHLHRIHDLSEVYRIPASVAAAAPAIADWVKAEIREPLFVGPDEESEQWVADVARRAGSPHTVLQKRRLGDRRVEISAPDLGRWRAHTPVLVDDIISTGHTLIAAIGQLVRQGYTAPVCIGVHALFADGAYQELEKAGARVVTCNTVSHASNAIDVSSGVSQALAGLLREAQPRPVRSA